jgi:hypothetical protein
MGWCEAQRETDGEAAIDPCRIATSPPSHYAGRFMAPAYGGGSPRAIRSRAADSPVSVSLP